MSSTEYHSLGGLNNKLSFVTVLKAGKSKIKVLTDMVLGEGPPPGLRIGCFFFFSFECAGSSLGVEAVFSCSVRASIAAEHRP